MSTLQSSHFKTNREYNKIMAQQLIGSFWTQRDVIQPIAFIDKWTIQHKEFFYFICPVVPEISAFNQTNKQSLQLYNINIILVQITNQLSYTLSSPPPSFLPFRCQQTVSRISSVSKSKFKIIASVSTLAQWFSVKGVNRRN